MRDYRTWWRKGLEAWDKLPYVDFRWEQNISDKDDLDCAWEQIWAIRAGLAENPELAEEAK